MARRKKDARTCSFNQGADVQVVAEKEVTKKEARGALELVMKHIETLALAMVGVELSTRRIGIDFGRCIASDVDEQGNKIPVIDYHLRPLIAGALWMIRLLVVVFGSGSVFIIRNGFGPNGENDDQEFIRQQTEKWFELNNFFALTGVKPENVFYPETREGKQELCVKLGLTELIEDRAEVAKYLTRTRWVSFTPHPVDLKVHLADVPNDVMNGMVPVYSWIEVGEYFFEGISFERLRIERVHAYMKARKNFQDGQAAIEKVTPTKPPPRGS